VAVRPDGVVTVYVVVPVTVSRVAFTTVLVIGVSVVTRMPPRTDVEVAAVEVKVAIIL
jgi:hypothetical protein